MSIQEQMKTDYKTAMKAKEKERVAAFRVIMGEFARSQDKELADSQVTGILRKLIKSEQETLAASNMEGTTPLMELAEGYLPKQVSEEAIKEYITTSVDFSQFKNKMQAMGPIMKHFGETADGNMVKDILAKHF